MPNDAAAGNRLRDIPVEARSLRIQFVHSSSPQSVAAFAMFERLFKRYDEDASGELDLEEFEVLLERFGIFEDLMHVAK